MKEWYELNGRRDASPVVIRRKFGYFERAVARLTKAKKKLKLAEEDFDTTPYQLRYRLQSVETQTRRADQAQTRLENSVRFALARIEPGSPDNLILRQRQPSVRESHRGARNRPWYDLLRYYAASVSDFVNAKRMNAGSSSAAAVLMAKSSNLVGYHKYRSYLEEDDADQQAWLGLQRAAEKFCPHKGVDGFNEKINAGKMPGLAQFTTTANNWIRRFVEVRKSAECPVGVAIVSGKKIKVGTIHVADSDNDGAKGTPDLFHPSAETDFGISVDVQTALGDLDDLERVVAERYLMGDETLREIALDLDVDLRNLKKTLRGVKGKLAASLSAFDPCPT